MTAGWHGCGRSHSGPGVNAHDRIGFDDSAPAKSWNLSHQSRSCSADRLKPTGGAGLCCCFAAD